ncbi:MAG: gliding motility-associated C-terminal domain-containing protein [Saprospiraceae bacterium]|nr:gliding motility-associated C-terminal domain-containing protein [Saprospiraceae bacterium]
MKGILKIYLPVLLTVMLMSMSRDIYSLHIIGGDVVYKCLGKDSVKNEVRFQITFTMYRDSKSNGADFDDPANFGIYRGSGNSWTFVRTVGGIRVQDKRDIDIMNNNPCILVPVNVGVQSGKYIFEVTLPIINETYMIAFQRCCRNTTILNLAMPGSTGAAFTTEINPDAQRACNNSPTFNSFPPVVICVNRPINYNHSAKDIDGDSLVYEFCNPLTAGGTDGATTPGSPSSCTGVTPSPQNCRPPFDFVTFNTPNFTFDKPMGGNPVVNINPLTGIIGGSPNLLGQYVVGVCVKEYRNGKLIGTLRRDFQFNVTTCEVAVVADLKASAKTQNNYTINSCGDFTIDFLNLSTDVRYIQNYYWEFDIKGKKELYDTRNVSVTFPGLGSYTATMILNKDIPGLAECSDTASITVNLYPSINADFDFQYDTCVAGPVIFKDKSASGAGPIQKWSWNFQEGISAMQNPIFEYEKPGLKTARLIVDDINLCKDTLIKTINYFPVPSLLVIEPNTFTGCQPASIFFDNLSTPIDDTYEFEWQFGDGNTSDVLSPTNTYKDVGTYTVSLKLISPIGCETVKTWPNLIKVVPSPVAGFSFTPEEPSLINNTVQFIDESKDAVAYLWKFDSLAISLVKDPSYTFRDTGVFNIQQIVLHPSGCSDTASVLLPIYPLVKLFVPTAFTPNNDGLNDDFIPKGIFEGLRNYSFTIWNRWGDKIFDTDNFLEGWNGLRNNSGAVAPPGVYAYVIEYIDPLGDTKTLKGHCTLIR